MTTLESEFMSALKNDARWAESPAFVKGVYIMGAQAALMCIKDRCPHPVSKDMLFDAIEAVNEEIGRNLLLGAPTSETAS